MNLPAGRQGYHDFNIHAPAGFSKIMMVSYVLNIAIKPLGEGVL